MKLNNDGGQLFVPNNIRIKEALERTDILCIAAHQDDTEIMAYHAIEQCYGKENKWFSNVTVSNGSGSPRNGIYENYTDEQMIQVRAEEQNKAALLGKYSIQIQLGYASQSIKENHEKLREELEKIILIAKPRIILTHNLADKHETHVAVAMRVINVLKTLKNKYIPEKLYGMEVWRGLDWLLEEDKKVFDASSMPNLSQSILGVFDSQICGGKRYDKATIGRRCANATFLENHGVDEMDQAIYGIDMTDIIIKNLDCCEFITDYVERFKQDIHHKIQQFS